MKILSYVWFLGLTFIVYLVVGFSVHLFAILVPCFIYGIICQLAGAEEPFAL